MATRPIDRRAQQTAAMLRRCGYPDAVPEPAYCIDGEIGPDNFYTEAVSIYVGEYKPETIRPSFLKLLGLTQ